MHLKAVWQTNKAAACVGTPLLFINFDYEIDLSVAYLIYLCILLFDYLFGYCEIILNRKELNVFEACVGTLSLQENCKTDKKQRYCMSMSFDLLGIKTQEC